MLWASLKMTQRSNKGLTTQSDKKAKKKVETRNHSKNGVTPKSQVSRKI